MEWLPLAVIGILIIILGIVNLLYSKMLHY